MVIILHGMPHITGISIDIRDMVRYANRKGISIGVPWKRLSFVIITLNGKTKNSDIVPKKRYALLSSGFTKNCSITVINIHSDIALRKSCTDFAKIYKTKSTVSFLL